MSSGRHGSVSWALVTAFAWSALLVVGAFLVPAYSGSRSVALGGGAARTVATSSTLVAANGLRVLIPVAAPAVITVIVWIAVRHKRLRGSSTADMVVWVLVAVLAVICFVGSVGLYMVPVVALLAYAASRAPAGAS